MNVEDGTGLEGEEGEQEVGELMQWRYEGKSFGSFDGWSGVGG